MYQNRSGQEPYSKWVDGLDQTVRARIYGYVERLARGAAKKNVRSVGDGVFELKIDTGPGYRVYFGEVGKVIILLLLGGDKGSQFRDIRQAKEFWRDHVSK